MNALTVSLPEKFKAASEKKVTMADFSREFLQQFLSAETKTAYTKDLLLFFSFLAAGDNSLTQPADIKAFHFQLYRDHLLEQDLASATVTRRMVAVRSFVKWAVSNKLMEYNPLDAIKLPKVTTETPTVAFDDAEVVAMINAAEGRDRLVLVLLFNLGLRRSELANIKCTDIIQERGHTVLVVKGKGEKTRLLPLNGYVVAEIAKASQKTEYLIPGETGGRIDVSTIYRLVKKYAKQVGIKKSVSPHSCRSTLVSHLLDTAKVDIRTVADMVGHANVVTTQIYDKRRNQLKDSAAYRVDYGGSVGGETK